MERQIESPSAPPRLFNEKSWRDLLPEAVHKPLRQAAQEFFISAVPIPEDENRDDSGARQTIADTFYQQLNSDFLSTSGGNALTLSQSETDYGVLLMKLASTQSGPARDGLLRDITLAKVKLITKEERAPLTRGLRGLIQKAGGQRATGWLKPGSDEKRLQVVEGVVLQKLGHQDLRMLFEAKEETPQQVLEKFMGKSVQVMVSDIEDVPRVLAWLKKKAQDNQASEASFGGEEQIKKTFGDRILKWFKNINWKFVGKGSAAMLGGIGLAELLKFSLFTESLMGSVLVGVNLLLRKVGGAERVEAFIKSREVKYPHASERLLNRVVMATATGELRAVRNALRVVESPEAMFVGLGISLDAGARSIIAAVGARQLLETRQAGAGEPGGYQTESSSDVRELQQHAAAAAPGGEPVLRSSDAFVGGGQAPAVEQPPVLSPEAGEFVNQAGEVAAQEVKEMAEAAQGAAEMAARQAALEAATHVVEVQPGDTLTALLDAAGSIDSYGADFTNTVLQSADILTGPQNPNRDMARALVEFIKAHPGGVNWRDAINGVGSLAKEIVGGVPLKDAIAQATRMIYPGQEIKVVVGAALP